MNEFLPQSAVVEEIDRTVADNYVFTFRSSADLEVMPGQFVEISLPGIGAFPVSLASYPAGFRLQSCIRRAGRVTGALYSMDQGAEVGVRGPFGKGFPLDAFRGRDALLIAGGLGMAPLRGLLHALLQMREEIGHIILLYGTRSPEALLFQEELERLGEDGMIRLRFSVDFATELPWAIHSFVCKVGIVPELLEDLDFSPERTTAAVCGPPSLYSCVPEELFTSGIDPERIFVTLERRMKCGIGECCHCVAGGVFICREGPVFSLARLRGIENAI